MGRPNPRPAPARLRRVRLFAGSADEPRSRRAGDLFLLIASTLGLLVALAFAEPSSRLETALVRVFAAVPAALDTVWLLLIRTPWVVAVLLVLAALVRRRWALVRDMVVAAVLGAGIVRLGGVGRLDAGATLPIVTAGAVLVTAHPHLVRSLRLPVSLTVAGAALGAALSLQTSPTMAVACALAAVVAGTVVHLTFGSARGRPTLEDVAGAMAELGVEARILGVADRQESGVYTVDAVDDGGDRLLIEVYGRDAHDTKLLRTAWRAAWYRGNAGPSSRGRLGQVEHEALVTLLASRAGVPTDDVVTAGASSTGDAYLVLKPKGSPLPATWQPDLMESMWSTLGRLHSSGIVHGQIDPSRMFLVDAGRVGLSDFAAGAVTTSPARRRQDQAQLLVATALSGDPDTAITAAHEALGNEEMLAMLPLVQAPTLTPAQRRAAKTSELGLDDLRERAAQLTGGDAPDLQKLRRVTWGTISQTALMLFAFLALSRVVGGIDFAELGSIVAGSDWLLIGAAFLVAQVPTFARALSALGASPQRIALGPLYALQVATHYISLVIPSAAGRIALNVRFFQRQGLPRTTALTVGALDGVAGFVTQVTVLVLLLSLTLATLDLDFELSLSSGIGRVLAWILGGALAGAIVVLAVRPWRERITGTIRTIWADASHALVGLGSGRRLALLFGGNAAVDVFNAISLEMFLLALGYSLGLGELMVIGISVMLLAGLMPVPGGIGVTEGALVFGMVGAGLDDEVAFAAMVLFRMATFYIPPIWGYLTMRWLQRNDYL